MYQNRATLIGFLHVQVEGDLRTREYTQKVGGRKSVDVTKSITEVRVSSLTKLDRPRTATQAVPTSEEVPV